MCKCVITYLPLLQWSTVKAHQNCTVFTGLKYGHNTSAIYFQKSHKWQRGHRPHGALWREVQENFTEKTEERHAVCRESKPTAALKPARSWEVFHLSCGSLPHPLKVHFATPWHLLSPVAWEPYFPLRQSKLNRCGCGGGIQSELSRKSLPAWPLEILLLPNPYFLTLRHLPQVQPCGRFKKCLLLPSTVLQTFLARQWARPPKTIRYNTRSGSAPTQRPRTKHTTAWPQAHRPLPILLA